MIKLIKNDKIKGCPCVSQHKQPFGFPPALAGGLLLFMLHDLYQHEYGEQQD
jgi:hypothetical protein